MKIRSNYVSNSSSSSFIIHNWFDISEDKQHKERKKSKYGAKKVEIDGIKFDSQKERRLLL